MESVSYTHLDVYKRQPQGRAARILKRSNHVTIVLDTKKTVQPVITEEA